MILLTLVNIAEDSTDRWPDGLVPSHLTWTTLGRDLDTDNVVMVMLEMFVVFYLDISDQFRMFGGPGLLVHVDPVPHQADNQHDQEYFEWR